MPVTAELLGHLGDAPRGAADLGGHPASGTVGHRHPRTLRYAGPARSSCPSHSPASAQRHRRLCQCSRVGLPKACRSMSTTSRQPLNWATTPQVGQPTGRANFSTCSSTKGALCRRRARRPQGARRAAPAPSSDRSRDQLGACGQAASPDDGSVITADRGPSLPPANPKSPFSDGPSRGAIRMNGRMQNLDGVDHRDSVAAQENRGSRV